MIRRPPRSTLFPTRRSSDLYLLKSLVRCACGAMMTPKGAVGRNGTYRSEEHTSELQSRRDLVCRLLLEKKKKKKTSNKHKKKTNEKGKQERDLKEYHVINNC